MLGPKYYNGGETLLKTDVDAKLDQILTREQRADVALVKSAKLLLAAELFIKITSKLLMKTTNDRTKKPKIWQKAN